MSKGASPLAPAAPALETWSRCSPGSPLGEQRWRWGAALGAPGSPTELHRGYPRSVNPTPHLGPWLPSRRGDEPQLCPCVLTSNDPPRSASASPQGCFRTLLRTASVTAAQYKNPRDTRGDVQGVAAAFPAGRVTALRSAVLRPCRGREPAGRRGTQLAAPAAAPVGVEVPGARSGRPAEAGCVSPSGLCVTATSRPTDGAAEAEVLRKLNMGPSQRHPVKWGLFPRSGS